MAERPCQSHLDLLTRTGPLPTIDHLVGHLEVLWVSCHFVLNSHGIDDGVITPMLGEVHSVLV